MAKCGACGKFMSSGGAACTLCPLKYHMECVMFTKSTVVPSDWACPDCKKKQRKGDNSSTPVRAIGSAGSAPDPSAEDADVRAMRRDLAVYMAEQREFRDELRAAMATITVRVDGIERRLEAVENREVVTAAQSEEVAELQKTVNQLQRELNDRDQDALLSDLDIGHLPEGRGENVLHTVTVLAAKMGVTIEERDIVFAERVGSVGASGGGSGSGAAGEVEVSGASNGGAAATVGRPRRVVVRLARRSLRDQLLNAARVRRNFTTADMGLIGAPRRIYVNERLTRSNRRLFQRVREECRQRQWRYAWIRRGRIYAKQGEGKQAFHVGTDDDLTRIFKLAT